MSYRLIKQAVGAVYSFLSYFQPNLKKIFKLNNLDTIVTNKKSDLFSRFFYISLLSVIAMLVPLAKE